MSNEIKVFDLAAPQQALEVASILQAFVKEKNLTTNIQGKQYPLVEAWLFAGSQLGLYPLLIEVKELSTKEEIKYIATVEIRRMSDQRVMSMGVAVCSNKENSKKRFDEYAILSMAQTRATGKAFRNLIAWLMKAAGFEATPSEEMTFEPVPEFLQSWDAELKSCKSVDDLMNLYSGNKATIDADIKIKEMFSKRKKEIA